MRQAAAMGALFLAAACALAPEATTASLLVGAWDCQARFDEVEVRARTEYGRDGKVAFAIHASGQGGPLAFDAQGEGEGTWALLENEARLRQTVSRLEVTSAKANGRDVPAALAQALVEPALPDMSATAAIKVDRNSLALTAEDGTVTTCLRAAQT